MIDPILDASAKDLAQKLVDSNKTVYEFYSGVGDKNKHPTGETVVVVALVLKKESDVAAIKKVVTRMATQPIGEPCSCCGGSGRK